MGEVCFVEFVLNSLMHCHEQSLTTGNGSFNLFVFITGPFGLKGEAGPTGSPGKADGDKSIKTFCPFVTDGFKMLSLLTCMHIPAILKSTVLICTRTKMSQI